MFQLIGAIASLIIRPSKAEPEESKVEIAEGLVAIKDYPLSTITDLIIYPCKGTKGVHVKKAKLNLTGLELDREWYCLERDFDPATDITVAKRWVSITKSDILGSVNTRFEDKDGSLWLVFSHKSQLNDLWINTSTPPTEEKVTCLNNQRNLVESYSEGEDAAKWFSDLIGKDVILARSTNTYNSEKQDGVMNYQLKAGDKKSAGNSKAALHLVSQSSCDKLQTLIDPEVCKVNAEAFRPNIIIDGVEPYDEDDVREFEIDGKGITIRTSLNCKRCGLVNYDFDSESKNKNSEPLTTIAKTRYLKDLGPIFGLYCQPDNEGVIQVGDKIRYTKKNSVPSQFQ